MDTGNIGFIVIIALFAIAFRLLADRWDRSRINQYVAERGGTVNGVTWQPFGRGWFGEKGDRIYEVEYTDREGASHSGSCKTSMFSGVYFTDERTTSAVPPRALTGADREIASLERENERLRAEIRKLRDPGA
ncbi:hypothetical protein [Gemmatimonas sp.]|uniref:hypothetical protein n=1 Tax=Gemmatimonas sp. TaxID=1962908 RepID=UPI0035674193